MVTAWPQVASAHCESAGCARLRGGDGGRGRGVFATRMCRAPHPSSSGASWLPAEAARVAVASSDSPRSSTIPSPIRMAARPRGRSARGGTPPCAGGGRHRHAPHGGSARGRRGIACSRKIDGRAFSSSLQGVCTPISPGPTRQDLAPTLEAQLSALPSACSNRRTAMAGARRTGGALRELRRLARWSGAARWPVCCPEVSAVRPGLMLYGVDPAPHLSMQGSRPVMTLQALRSRQVRDVPQGGGVGLRRDSLPRRASHPGRDAAPRLRRWHVPISSLESRLRCAFAGNDFPLVGRVSMDFITVDMRRCAPVEPGDEAVIFGGRGEHAGDSGRGGSHEPCGTIGIRVAGTRGQRVPRVYVGGDRATD